MTPEEYEILFGGSPELPPPDASQATTLPPPARQPHLNAPTVPMQPPAVEPPSPAYQPPPPVNGTPTTPAAEVDGRPGWVKVVAGMIAVTILGLAVISAVPGAAPPEPTVDDFETRVASLPPESQVDARIRNEIRRPDRPGAIFTDVDFSGDVVTVEFASEVGLSVSSAVFAMEEDTVAVLQLLAESETVWTTAVIQIELDLIDEFGAASEQVVMRHAFSHTTTNMIQFDNLSTPRVLALAEIEFRHPAIR